MWRAQDIYFLEICIFHKICANGDDLFRLRPAQQWHCELSPHGFRQLQHLLEATPVWDPPRGGG